MSTRVVADGVPNEPVGRAQLVRLVEPILDLLGGIPADDVKSLRIDSTAVRATVVVRSKRGRRLVDSWAHLVVRIVPEDADL